MALQSRDLVMLGLGVLGDTPPNPIQPALRNGIHLRWAFARGRGFPWRGFYLYRRVHLHGDPICVSREVRTLAPGPLPGFDLNVSFARFSSDTRLVLTESWPRPGEVEFDLDGRTYLRVVFAPNIRARRVIATIGFRNRGEITITVLWDGVEVERRRVQGQAGQRVVEEILADCVTEVHFTAGPAALIDFCYVPIDSSNDATVGWQPLGGRICLPVTAPDYPCSAGPEHLVNSRAAARARIRYGDPNRLTAAPVIVYRAGSVAVTRDSPLVTGAGTAWTAAAHSGLVLQLAGENAAYVVAAVLASNRLVLNRPYSGTSGSGRAYNLQRDAFGQLHDYLAHMVSRGPIAGPMAGRMFPVPLAAPGTVSTTSGSDIVNGAGTGWPPTLVGLRFRVIATSTGSVSAMRHSEVIRGTGTAWNVDHVGMEIELGGDDRAYRIAEVHSLNRLRLDRPYAGPDVTGAYRLVERPLYRVRAVNSTTRLTLDMPYAGATAAGRGYELAVVLQAPGAPNQAPRLPRVRPLDIVLAGALDPGIAQMIGLYWVDETADPNTTYDYLLIADEAGIGNDAVTVLNAWIQAHYANADGFIAFSLRMAAAPALAAPSGARAYALPGVTLAPAADDVAGSAGVVWNLPVNEDGVVLPRSAVMYHVWRTGPGANAPAVPPPAGAFTLRTTSGPIVIASLRSASPATPQRPSDWPPFRLYFSDGNLREGWYSYAVNGIDIFGRHSAHSAAAEWWQWAPMPDPRPWYYIDPPVDARVHAHAIGLLDKTPPPPPAAVEAFALDPADPTVLRDNDFNTWRAALDNAAWYQALPAEQRRNVIGLRVRWRWRASQQAQAPDVREFRIYFQPGRCNARLGGITATADAGASFTLVTTDIANAAGADAYTGARLHHGNDNWEIVGNDASSPLRVRVRNIGPADNIRPPQHGPCSIVIPDRKPPDPPHPLFTDYSRALAWQDRFHVVPYDAQWRPDPAGDGRIYEVFLPQANGPVQAGVPLTTTLADPIVYAQIGVSAADTKRHTTDDARWSDPARWAGGRWGGADRFGNEGRVGGPATIFRVRREPPPTPRPALDDERVFATRADYHSRSYSTCRWVRESHVKAHVFRALDQALFAVDWEIRATPAPLDPADTQRFPSTPRWTPDRRGQIAAELNALDAIRATGDRARGAAAYKELSNDAFRILGGLPGRERAFTQLTIQALDCDDPAQADRRGPDDPSNYATVANFCRWVDTLDGRATNRYLYRVAHVDGAQNRSGLSLCGPAVWLPDVTAPRTPVITKVLGGDREARIRWLINREADLDRYLLFRADSADALRSLDLVSAREVIPDAAAAEQQEAIDGPLSGNRTYFYRLAARDRSGNVSAPSAIVSARVVDTALPDPPGSFTAAASTRTLPDGSTETGVLLTWAPSSVPLDIQVQRRAFDEFVWRALGTGWLPNGTTQYFDNTASAATVYNYRLRVRKESGRINQRYIVAGVSL